MEASIQLVKKTRAVLIDRIKLQIRRLKKKSKSKNNVVRESAIEWGFETDPKGTLPEHTNAIEEIPPVIVRLEDRATSQDAIVPSEQLLSEMKTAVQDYRDMLTAEEEFGEQIDIWKAQHDRLQTEIAELMQLIEGSQANVATEATPTQDMISMQEQLAALRKQKQAILSERDAGRKWLERRYEEVRCGQYRLFEMLGELFEADEDGLIEIPQNSGENAIREVTQTDQTQQPETQGPMQDAKTVSFEQKKAEEQAKKAERMLRIIDCWVTEVDRCQYSLYHRHETFQRLWQDKNGAIDRGEEVQTEEEFEIFCLQETQRFTKELIHAEAQLEEAKQAALDAGIQLLGSDLESGFLDRDDDGYLESEEREMCEAIDHERIQRWIEDTSDPQQSTGQVDHSTALDLSAFERQSEWQSKEVEVWESASMVAEGPSRRRIDKWREIADSQGNGLHEEFADGHSCQELCGEGLEASSSWGKDLTAAMKSVGEE